jgi:hypothetical protein
VEELVMGYNRSYYGVVAKNNEGFEIFTHRSSVNFTTELESYCNTGKPVNMVMKNQDGDCRTLFKAYDKTGIVLGKDDTGGYHYYLGGKDIEKALTKAIGKAVSIVLHITAEGDINNGQANKG